MMGLTHAFFASLVYMLFWRVGLVQMEGLYIISLLLGSVLPDIDHPHGLLYQFLETPQWLTKGISGLVPHRGPTHTLWAAMIFLAVSIPLELYFGFDLMTSAWFFVGYLSHLLTDSLTRSGVKWLAPIRKRSVKWILRTGSKGETYFLYLIVFAILAMLITK